MRRRHLAICDCGSVRGEMETMSELVMMVGFVQLRFLQIQKSSKRRWLLLRPSRFFLMYLRSSGRTKQMTLQYHGQNWNGRPLLFLESTKLLLEHQQPRILHQQPMFDVDLSIVNNNRIMDEATLLLAVAVDNGCHEDGNQTQGNKLEMLMLGVQPSRRKQINDGSRCLCRWP
jgi:hypothetical protein